MKKIFILFIMIFVFCFFVYGQEYKEDYRIRVLKEDPNNEFNSTQITKLDLLQALEFAGIKIKKFYLGNFDKKYKFIIMIDEYKNDELIDTKVVFDKNNQYYYQERGKKKLYVNYIDQLKIITKKKENKLDILFVTYKGRLKEDIKYKKNDEKQFYVVRYYLDTEYKVDKKIPLMIYASSWYDEQIDNHRFCGAVNLKSGTKETKELLKHSPHYFIVNYKVTEIE